MKVEATDSFFKSLRVLGLKSNIFYKYFWKDLYSDWKNGIKNLIKFRKLIWMHRDWDYAYILKTLQFQLKILADGIEKYAHEVDEDRLPKIAKMRETIELINNHLDDNYAERCGYVYTEIKFIKSDEHEGCYEIERGSVEFEELQSKAIKKARELENFEFNKIFENMKDMRGWWD
jgi:hypothetical protein